ncbi:hypothetical protein BGZ65_001493 [Modicella reniformis]|uniref:Arrestin C-terminal-like domain-containing protein n=1 Tax=Modicella reniformis TaxID=1440133 RepID=A0A9P6J1Y8_9FUNG|nr:hypothetical protein BGZ65_001493 [Modicella reniformis]
MHLSGDPKVRNLVIHVDTGSTIGTKELPLVYGHPDNFTLLHATVTFESSHDCKAKAVEILFKAAVKTHYFAQDEASRRYEGEQILYSKQWDLDVEKPKQGWIAKGNYARQCSVILDPLLPSSSESPFGSMRYFFEARLKGAKGFGIARIDHVVTQDVWVLNSSLPFPSTVMLDNPITVHEEWKGSLAYSVTVPMDTLHFGQVVPITIQLQPFYPGCAHEGEEALVTSANFTLRETKMFRAMFVRDTHETSEKLLNIAVNSGWPQSVDGWQRTIHVSLPSSPAMSADMQTKYLDITHTLVVMIEFRTSKMTKPDKLKAQVDVKITAPCFVTSTLPRYGDAVPVESVLLLEPPPAIDANEELPSYSRYE